MKTHYYLSWFNDFFPEKLVKWLHEDIKDRKSLVMISAQPSGYKGEQVNIDDVSERTWFNQANIIFDEYHFIDYRMQKEDAQRFIQNASVIFTDRIHYIGSVSINGGKHYDDHLYIIPFTQYFADIPVIYIREDLREKLGFTKPISCYGASGKSGL